MIAQIKFSNEFLKNSTIVHPWRIA